MPNIIKYCSKDIKSNTQREALALTNAPTLVIGGYYTICLIWVDNSFSVFNISETKVQ